MKIFYYICRPFANSVFYTLCGSSSVGRASAFQAECREFDPRLPLKEITTTQAACDFFLDFADIAQG